uniref:Secreted protein n=1 Tax=Ixodes ricinus TaxID=34613 RepID=A0A6B0TZS6_IXORI
MGRVIAVILMVRAMLYAAVGYRRAPVTVFSRQLRLLPVIPDCKTPLREAAAASKNRLRPLMCAFANDFDTFRWFYDIKTKGILIILS